MNFQNIKSEPLGEKIHGLYKDLNETAEDIPIKVRSTKRQLKKRIEEFFWQEDVSFSPIS